MQYMLLIYSPPSDWQSLPAEQRQAVMEAYGSFTEELQTSGKLVAGDALQPVSTATSVRVRDGETLTTDGPFAETKEVLGGLYLLEAANLDDAIAFAARIPNARHGAVEVRPLVEH
jgi:hypothetical protein